MTQEITKVDIARLVPALYDRVRQDAALGPIFNGAISDWPHHLDKLIRCRSSSSRPSFIMSRR